MKDQEYLTVAEYAKATGKSRQAVYNALHDNQYVDFTLTITKNGRKVTVFKPEILDSQVNSQVKSNTRFTSAQNDDLRETIEEYRERERFLREQIKQLQNSNAELLKLLENQQLIQAKQLQLLKAPEEPVPHDPEDLKNDPEDDPDQIPERSDPDGGSFRAWLRKLFR